MLKNYNKIVIIFSIILILFITIGSISASENATEDISLENSEVDVSTVNAEGNDDNLSAESSDVKVLEESSDENALSQASDEAIISSSQNNQILSTAGNSQSNTVDRVYESTAGECSAVTQQYTSGKIVYKVKVYDIVSYNGVKYKDPKYGQAVQLRVYTGSSYKTYSATIGDDGTASINIPNLAIGKHKVELYYGNNKMATSTIKIVKSATKVYAPVKTIKHKKNTYYKIKVLDSHGNPAKKVVLKVKVFTGKKSKTYSLKTNAKGVAKLKTKGLDLGTHKIIIKSKNKKYKISKKTKIIIKKKVPKKAEKLSVTAPASIVKHNANNYYEIGVKNSYADPVKKLTLKVKVFTGKKSKTYSVKTNSKGVAKLQTKSLALGTHKVSITTSNKKYKVSKSSKIIVQSTVIPEGGATKLKSLNYYPKGNGYSAKLTWHAKSGSSYQVLKKTNGGYGVIATVQATSDEASYQEDVGNGDVASYTVREIKNGNELGTFDNEGLTLMGSPNVAVDFQNLKAVITWSKVSDATKYRVYRKIGNDGQYKCIAVVDASQSSYTDFYYNYQEELADLLDSKTFIDPSYNSLHYTVRACNEKEVDNVEKVSYGLYLEDGDFHLEPPSIIYLKNNSITWGRVPNAEGYIILKKSEGSDVWQEIARAAQASTLRISTAIEEIENTAYYAVQAFATKNGEMVFSEFDKGFTLKNYDENNSQYRVLFFGDSITFGSPYYSSSTIHVFSMPHRISQLTGCVYYNPSIPGSTYHDLGVNPDGTNVENTNYYRYRITREVVDAIDAGQLPGNWQTLDSAKNSEGVTNTKITDYNVVVLSAGTNDYLDNSELGDINSQDTYYFNGALNHILGKIKEASDARVANGSSPIKVVFVDLFYSDRTNDYKEINNRDITPNKIGLTLMDYQKALDQQLIKWAKAGLDVFNFNTRDYNIATTENCPYTACDNLHFTKFTYGQYGNAIAQFLVDNVFKD